MEITSKPLILAFLITISLLFLVLITSNMLKEARYISVEDEMQQFYSDISDIQALMLLAEDLGPSMACVGFSKKLKDLDERVWKLGMKIDQYRIATEEFKEDEFYLNQKVLFTQNQIIYLSLLNKIVGHCDYEIPVISFFFVDSEDCDKCDDQSFVLGDINNELGEEVSIFSFDLDLDVIGVESLAEYYNLSNYPCIVIEGTPYCGMQDKETVYSKLCTNYNLSVC